MKIVLAGADGQVGWEIVRRFTRYKLLALDRCKLDITDAQAVQQILRESAADVVINAAAYTAVDRAEQEPELACAVNRDGPANLAATCAKLAIPLLHISTDYVFDGTNKKPYTEDDPAAPLGVYGMSKWQGEEVVRRTLFYHLILRVSWVFGIHGQNFVKTMLRLARKHERLQVVADQLGCPTYAGDIAEVLLSMVDRIAAMTAFPLSQQSPQQGFWGTYHYCGTPPTTWYGFAQAIVNLARQYEPLQVREVVPIATADYPTPAARPANSVLNCMRLKERFALEPGSWRLGLEAVLKALHARPT